MRNLFKEPLTYVVLYLIVGVITFGNAWNYVPETEKGHFAGEEYIIHNGPGIRLMAGAMSAIAWPFYWSVRLQK